MDEVVKVELSEVNRRGFVSGIVAAGAGAALGAPLGGDAGASSARPFKVCVFSDIHFDDFWTNSDDTSFLDGIPYWDVNSANYQWFGKRHDKYPPEYVKRHPGAVHILGWTKPLSAILSLWPDGWVRIEGAEADWLFGVTAKAAGFPECDADGRETHPKILSADFRLFA